MTDTYTVPAGDLDRKQALNLASKLLQFVTQRPVPRWKK